MLLFIYGTLKRGGRWHWKLNGQQFMGEAATVPEYMLHLNVNYPMIYWVGEGGVSVQGELWEVDARCLKQLDTLEMYPVVFDRQPIELTNGQFATVYIPRNQNPGDRPVVGAVWENTADVGGEQVTS